MESPEFLNNMKSIPTKDSKEYESFWMNERHKAEYGLTVNGVYVPGFLYWHTQLWYIYIHDIDPNNPNVIKRRYEKSKMRDNEWIVSEAYEEAQRRKEGVLIFGSRRLGKSEFLASHIGRYSTLYEGSENVLMGGNWGDVDVITHKITQGLNRLPEAFKFGRLSENLRKEIELGFKQKNGTRLSWSKIIIRNHDNGLNTEAPAGLTPLSFVMDEVGKSSFAQVLEAAKPSFTSPHGWACVPILTGTSGDIKASSDAEKIFLNPDAHNFLVRHLVEEGNKKVSVFISGLRRMEGKVETTLGNFIQNEKGILLPEDSELYKIPFQNSDFEKAEKIIDIERAQAAKSPDVTALLKATMYYPKNTKELFLSDNGNKFPIEAINEHIAYLQANPDQQGLHGIVYRDVNNKVVISFNTTKKPILDYPIKPDAPLHVKDACPVFYELPDNTLQSYTYISGADPYNTSSSVNSDSLGALYIFKRMYDPIKGTFQRRMVCSYVARPQNLKDFHNTVEMLLELYNATCMPENAGGNTFIPHFDHKNKGWMIADSYNLLKEISPQTSITNQPKGLPATPKVQAFYKELVYQYCMEEITMGETPESKPIIKLGVVRIPDIGLLRELAAFNDTGNFDRYVAFGHALVYENYADKIYNFTRTNYEPEKIQEKKKPSIRSPFNLGQKNNPFGYGNTNPFGVKSIGKL